MKYLAILLALLADTAIAQNTIDFSVDTTTGAGQVTATATWASNPPAQSCLATGAADWSGPKAPSGSQPVTVNVSTTLNIQCTWQGDSIVTFSWVNPTENMDNSPYTDPKLTRIKYTFNPTLTPNPSTDAANEHHVDAPSPQTVTTVTGITDVGTLRAVAYAQNQNDVFSDPSNIVTKMFTGLITVTENVGITVNSKPKPPTSLDGQ